MQGPRGEIVLTTTVFDFGKVVGKTFLVLTFCPKFEGFFCDT